MGIAVVYFHHCIEHCTIKIYYNLLIDSPTDWHLGCFQFMAIIKNATVNLLYTSPGSCSKGFSREYTKEKNDR